MKSELGLNTVSIIKALIEFEDALSNCYKTASGSYSNHSEFWNSLSLAKLARVNIYKSIHDEILKRPTFFRIAQKPSGIFFNLYFKTLKIREQILGSHYSESRFSDFARDIEIIVDNGAIIPSIIACINDFGKVISTLNSIQNRQVFLLQAFTNYSCSLISGNAIIRSNQCVAPRVGATIW